MMATYPKKKVDIDIKTYNGTVKTGKTRGTYWSTDHNLRKLLAYRHSIEDMKLILEPMCYLFIGDAAHFDKKITERDEYFYTLQKQLVKWFLEKYSSDKSKKDKKDRFLD